MKSRKKIIDLGKLKKNIQRGFRKIYAAKPKLNIRRRKILSADIILDALENLSDGDWD